MIIAAGTGINPFLDLFDFLLQKIIYRAVKQRFGDQAEKLNPYAHNFELLDQIQIRTVASFASKEEFYGSSLLTDLFFLNEAHNRSKSVT